MWAVYKFDEEVILPVRQVTLSQSSYVAIDMLLRDAWGKDFIVSFSTFDREYQSLSF